MNNTSITTLSSLECNKCAKISDIQLDGLKRRRFMDLGIIKNAEIKAVRRALGKEPTAFLVRGSLIALRKCDTDKILIYNGGDYE